MVALSICGSVTAHVPFLDTRGPSWAKFVESAQEKSVWEEGGEIGDHECLRQLVAEFKVQQAWVIICPVAQCKCIMSGSRTEGL